MQGRRDSLFGRQVALSVLSDNPLACPSLDIVSVPVPERARFDLSWFNTPAGPGVTGRHWG